MSEDRVNDDCLALQRWLDDGGSASLPPPEHEAHARDCEPCARVLEADRAVRAALAAGRSPAPQTTSQFTDRVMARVAAEPRAVAAPSPRYEFEDMLPWWVRMFAQPATALAFVVIGVGYVLFDALATAPATLPLAVTTMFQALSPAWARFASPLEQTWSAPGGAVALTFGILPAVVLVGYAGYAGAMALARPRKVWLATGDHRSRP